MERHWILGLVAVTTAALLWREVYSIACLSSKTLDNDNGVNGLEDCTNIEECEPDEVCYVEKFVTENNPSAVKFRAGCRNIRDCKLISCSNQVTESVPTPRVGKRYVDEISLCTECCYNDTCNTKGCGSNAIDPERAKFHKKCFNCQHIKENDNSTCKQMVWCEQPTQVCAIYADAKKREYHLKCELKTNCDLAILASNISRTPLSLKCFDGHLQNYNPVSNHTATVVADILPCPTGIVPTTPTTTTQKTTTTTTATTTTAPKTTTTTTTTTMTPKTTTATTATTTPRVTTSITTQSSTVATSPKATPTVPKTSTSKITTPLPTPTSVKVTTAIKQPTLKTTINPPTTPKRPTLPPLTVTKTLAPTSPNTNSPSLPPVNPTIPIATKVVTMAPISTTTKALPITTTTTPKPTTTATAPKATTTTTTPKPTTTTTTPKPTTTTTTPKPTTTTTTPTPTTTTTHKPTTTMKTTTRVTTTPTTTALKTTTKAGPPAGHTIPPNPTVCFVCLEDAPDLCTDLYEEKSCAPPNNYCINQVTNYADGNKIVNRTCGNFDRCFKDWYHGSSDTDVCQTFDENQYITLDFECVYCCVKDKCNEDMKPPAETLYEDK